MLDWSLKFKFFDLNKITVFVLDEADVMIATQGHQVDDCHIDFHPAFSDFLTFHLQDQSIRIHKNLGSHCQMLLFSATYDQVELLLIWNIHYPSLQAVMDFAENIVSNPVTIKLRREEESLDNIKQVTS